MHPHQTPIQEDPRAALPQRKRLAHPPPIEKHNQPIIIFLTACIQSRQPLLCDPRMHSALREAWGAASTWKVGFYLLMPDHVHLFCRPGILHPPPLRQWVKFWKGNVRRVLDLERSIWQRDAWDEQMRSAEHYREKLAYVRMNPVRRSLAPGAEDWPFKGEMNPFEW